VIDADTRGHHYRIEYLGGDQIRISGHPSYCPTPVGAKLRGSLAPSGELEAGFVGRGMRLLFRRHGDDAGVGVITSAVTDVRKEAAGQEPNQ
jgi:hypothetical protein